MRGSKTKYWVGLFSLLLLVSLDQWTKHLATSLLAGKSSYVIKEGIFELRYIENRGAAFGILQNQRCFFLILTGIVLVAVIIAYLRISVQQKFFPLRALIVFIGAGAIGNMIDRLVQGYVVDFLYFSLIDFPVFNVADCYVTIAVFVGIFLLLFYYKDDDLKEAWS